MIRPLLLPLCILLFCQLGTTQPSLQHPLPKVDERVELLSIAWRLAGADEYAQNTFPKYVADIEQHFRPHANHALIQYIRKELFPLEIGYDAVMCMAVHLTPPPHLQPFVPFTEDIPEVRWNPIVSAKFTELLQEFYTDTKAADFFSEQQPMYASVADQFQKIYLQVDLAWYEQFFGVPPKDRYQILLGLGNGLANYSTKTTVDGVETVYAVIGAWNVEQDALPEYKAKDFMPMIVHELNHPYVNGLIIEYEEELQPVGTTLFAQLEEQMKAQAYEEWVVMLQEGLVRACVIEYMKAHDFPQKQIRKETDRQVERGFIWTEDLLTALTTYQNNRTTYPTLQDYMSEIVALFNHHANQTK